MQEDLLTDNVNNLIINHEATSHRQAEEWVMIMVQASFQRLKDRFVYEENSERMLVNKYENDTFVI